MYDVSEMTFQLSNAMSIVEQKIRADFATAFKTIYCNGLVPEEFPSQCPPIDQISLVSADDLKRVHRERGFYVILSDRAVDGNTCSLSRGTLRAIYRGECGQVRKRIQSHLFNAQYNAKYNERSSRYVADPKNSGRSFYEPHWPHCLKLDHGGQSGVNIDQPPHCDYKWFVLVHPMIDSSQQLRQIAELAFDDAFGHPAGSRERR